MQCSNSFEDITGVLQEIIQKCGETVHFGILDGGNVLYLSKVDTLEPVRMYAAIGKRLRRMEPESARHFYPTALMKN